MSRDEPRGGANGPQAEEPGSSFEPGSDRPLLPFLPLIYVAWADGDLDPEEIRRVRDRMLEVGRSCEQELAEWLDPASPPSPRRLRAALTIIRRAARDLPRQQRRSLAELGLGIARLSRQSTADDGDGAGPSAEATFAALAEVEEALGVAGHELTRELVPGAVAAPEAAVIEAVAGEGEAEAAAAPATFDPAAMTRLLDGEHAALRRRLRRRLCDEEFSYRYELDRPAYRRRILEQCRTLAAEGYGALGYPEAHGGGGDRSAFIAAFETLGLHDPSLLVKFGVQFGLFGGSIQMLGTERHHARYLAAIGSLELPGCFAMSETGHGSNVKDLETVARYDAATDEIVVHTPHPMARKDWIGNAARDGRVATVFAQLEVGGEGYGVHAVVVPIRDAEGRPMPGVTIEDCGHKVGLNGVDNGRLSFDQVRVPRENLLDRYGDISPDGEYVSDITSDSKRFFTMIGTLVAGRISVAGAALSAAKTALTIAVRYGAERRQFGPAGGPEIAILDYLTHQRRLMPRLATAYALTFAQRHLVELYLERDEATARRIESLAAGIKAFATRFNVDTLQTCRECCGGKGYLSENRFGPLRADTDVFTTFEGDNTVLLQLVARGLLTRYRRQFGDMKFANVVGYVSRLAGQAITELNPIVTRRTDESHLRSREFHLAAFRYREDHLLASVARRLKARLDAGMDSFLAINEVQDHLVKTARAHVERVILERFTAAVEELGEDVLARPLSLLCDLFALWQIERDRGWFLAHGYVEPPKAKAIRDLVNRLVREVRADALALVDGFGIPDPLLAAPIAVGPPGPGRQLA